MKIKNVLIITKLVCITVIISVLNLSSVVGGGGLTAITGSYSNIGYKPVPDTHSYTESEVSLNENLLYKEWCEETFDNGSYVYEAYKNIAFKIKHTPEPNRIDYWQTPMETARLKRGDCEDIVFSFFSRIPLNMKNAEIVWGWITDKRTKARWAHVWYQLTNNKGQKYVVEGFSNDWNGIIPMEIVQDTETRNPMLIISHNMLYKLSCILPKVEDWKMCQVLVGLFAETSSVSRVTGSQPFGINMNIQRYLSSHEYFEYPENAQGRTWQYTQYVGHTPTYNEYPVINNEISSILEKLHDVFSRVKFQK